MSRQTTVQLPVMHIPVFARLTIYIFSFLLHLLVALLIWFTWHTPEPDKPLEHSASYEQAPDHLYQYQHAPILFIPTIEPISSQDTLSQESSPETPDTVPPTPKPSLSAPEPAVQVSMPDTSVLLDHQQPAAPTTAHSQYTTPTSTRNISPATIKRHINFTDVAKGFLSFSSPKKDFEPSEQTQLSHVNQIKFERFAQRMLGAIHNAFKLLKQSLLLPYAPNGTTQVAVTLAPDGMLEHARIASASNNPYFDQFLLTVVKQGSSMFPPLPNGLEQQTKKMLIITTVRPTASGGTTLSFSLAQDAHTS